MKTYRKIVGFSSLFHIANKLCLRRSTLLLFSLFISLSSNGQTAKTHYLGFSTQYHQIKESANYGIVNQGLNLSLNYSYEKEMESRILTYTPHIAFGPNYRYGLGLNWHFKFIDFFYGWKISQKTNPSLHLGIYGAVNNFWQLYPELQSGHMFWFTTIEIGPKFQGKYSLGDREIFIKASTSLYGLTSRPIDQTEQYFYSLSLGNVLKDSFSNMKFGSNNIFNHTFFEVDYSRPGRNKIIMGYAFEYFSYYDAPSFSYMTHSIALKWRLGK